MPKSILLFNITSSELTSPFLLYFGIHTEIFSNAKLNFGSINHILMPSLLFF
jgi:hypothetical protein